MKLARLLVLAAALVLVNAFATSGTARAEAMDECQGSDLDRRIASCTELIDRNEPATDIAQVYALRGLAHSIKGEFDKAIADFDAAISRRPAFAAALNNRAWAYYRVGKPRQGLPDIERSIELEPDSGFAYDTRAHLRQALGDAAAALRDYDRALFYGGNAIASVYQCGLAQRGLYSGPLDGAATPSLMQSLEKCAATPDCDPLPPDEKCR